MVTRNRRAVLASGAAAFLAGGLVVAAASPIPADYANAAVRQVELPGNGNMPTHPWG